MILHLLQPVKKTFSQRMKRKNKKDLAQKVCLAVKISTFVLDKKKSFEGGKMKRNKYI